MATGTASSRATNRHTAKAIPAVTAAALPHLSQPELDDLFASSPAGPTPAGVADGTAIVAPGTPVAAGLQPLLHFFWRGKVFYPERSDLLNRISPLGVLFARAQVYRDASWVDGNEAIILDYSTSALPFRAVRDEIREVASGLYLGVVFWVGSKTINFSLQFR
ncbi:MAG: hypothetical protein M3071_20480 [Actinomycetota bacterium]|nr:hypothetical protein [Actinomycetota bacterium]